MQEWLDGYEHIPVLGCTGPDTMVDGYAWKLVLHTTESGPGSSPGLINLFQAQPCYCPQFGIDPSDGRKIQFIPMSWSAAALRGGRYGYETNRGCAIQVEIVGRAQETVDWPDEWLQFLGEFVADLVRAGAPINLDNLANFDTTGTVATESSPYRFGNEEWKHFDGICGHIHVPFNDHYDPFHLNVPRVVEFAKASLAGEPAPAPGPNVPPVVTPVPEDPPYGQNMIGKGMQGGIVMFAQQLLIGLGYDCGPGGADGDFGDDTEEAVKSFQRDHGLEDDGIIGPKTQEAIGGAYAGQPVPGPVDPAAPVPAWPGNYLTLGSSGDDVSQWQAQMASRGWTIQVDGDYGDQSKDVCTKFQVEKGLDADGVVGPLTWDAAWTAPVT